MEETKLLVSAADQNKATKQHWFIAQNLESNTQIFYNTIDNMQLQQYNHESRISELQGRRIRGYFHGWVILSSHPDDVLWSVWNPLTSKLIHLPPLINQYKHHYECCLSAAPPGDQGSFLLLTKAEVPTIVICQLDDCCNKKWTEISYDEQLRSIRGANDSFLEKSSFFEQLTGKCIVDDDCFLERPTCFNGKIYALTLGRCYNFVIQVDIIVVNDEEEEEVVIINLMPFVEIPNNFCPHDIFLKGSRGKDQLFCIDVCFTDDETVIGNVYLYKLDITSMKWDEMVDLEDAIFFIQLACDNYSSCYYDDSVVNSQGGGYVHVLDDQSGEIIYSYHVKDRTMSVFSTPRAVPESQASAWAMLEWRRLEDDDHVESNRQKEEEKGNDHVESKQKEEEKGDIITLTSEESYLLNLPIDVLKTIMEFFIGREYMRFRATCKLCYSVAPPVLQCSNKTSLRRFQNYLLGSPLLMVLDNYRGIITFIDPMRNDKYFIKIPQELKGDYQIHCCKYGWVLMYQLDGPLVFFNPFTGDIRELPVEPYLRTFCFSAPPTSPDCTVVGFTDQDTWSIFLYSVSRKPAVSYRIKFGLNIDDDDDDPYSYHFPTFIGRDVYALRNNKGLDVLRNMVIEDAHYREEVVDEVTTSDQCKSLARYFLSSCDQHSLLVIVGQFGESVEVFKATYSSEEWEKIDKLGNHMIYISDTSCVCLEAKSPEMGNKIYFPRLLHNNETKIVFYSLETCKFHTFDGKNVKESFGANLFGTKQHCCPHTWIEPNWS